MHPQELLLALVGNVICGNVLEERVQKSCTMEVLEDTYALAVRHDLAHLAGQALSKCDLPESEPLKKMKASALGAVYRQTKLNYEYLRICRVLEEGNIPYIPLKGAVLREYYPEPWMRTSCDIDVLVRESQLDQAIGLLKENLQYTANPKTDHDVSLYSQNGVHLELHYDTIQERYNTNGCRNVLNGIWEDAKPIEPNACHLWLSDEMFYFYHIAHMVKHFEVGGCGIRPFLDIWIMNHRMEPNRQKREQLLAEGGLLAFAQGAERVSECWFSGKELSEMDAAVSSYVLHGGLYGDNANRAALGQAKNGGRLKYLLTQRIFMPYDYLKAEYPILNNRKWLCPAYQVVRWARMLCRGGLRTTVKELKANVTIKNESENPLREMLDYLGLS